ncbi:MAG: hypothetical protein R3293_18440 [Candidatus Promineifilaceae bacterium]|nr:hypothetical protein [Candidatus Promineifilaceae bacterium]
MYKTGSLTKVLAAVGTALVWLPLLAPLFFTLISLGIDGVFRFDYLMPAELFPLVLVGGALLFWVAWRAHVYLALVGMSLIIAIGTLFGSQLLAIVTGLASGETTVGGWQWLLVLFLLAIYTMSIAMIGVGGILLVRVLFKPLSANHHN